MNTKPVQVAMLQNMKGFPKENCLWKERETNKLYFNKPKASDSGFSQHLYFTTNEPIQEGDWYLFDGLFVRQDQKFVDCKNERFQKIICSSDPSLGLPAIPLTWIRDVYVPSNGSIKEVKLELEEWNTVNNHELTKKHLSKERWVYVKSELPKAPFNDAKIHYYERIKLTQNNEVVIVDEPNILEMTLKATTLSDDFIDQELEDVANNYAGDIVEEMDSDGISLSSLDLALAVKFGADWKAEQVANDTMEFIDWILKMRYLPDLSGEVWLSDFGPDGHVKPFTTKELYDIWQQSK